MKNLIKIEIKRILNLKIFLIFWLIIMVFSINSAKNSMKNYDVYDSNGQTVISSKDNIRESKLKNDNDTLDKDKLSDIISKKNSSKYLYNVKLEEIVKANYQDRDLNNINDNEINNFYNQRILNIEKNLKESSNIKYTDKEVNSITSKSQKLSTPIKIGYAEGWRNLNSDIRTVILVILVFISAILLPLFTEDPNTNMKELSKATERGKISLNIARIITAFGVGVIMYIVLVVTYSIIKLTPFGIQGFNLPIQESVNYFFSTYNITYLNQLLINISIGFIAMLFTVSFTLLFTTFVDQVLSGAVGVVFLWISMIIMDQMSIFKVNHYFANFLPLKMTDFSYYYTGDEIYRVLGNSVSSLTWVIFVSLVISILMIIFTIIISNIRLSNKLYFRSKKGINKLFFKIV